METHGRSRDSIADIQENLETVFSEHPSVTSNADGDDCVPVEVLPEIFRALTDMHDGREILSDSDLAQLRSFAEQQPGLLVTPASLVGLLAALTKNSPRDSPELEYDMELRGRNSDRDELEGRPRSSSTDSEGTSYQHSGSRPSSRGPPQTPKNSVFDTHRRQRSTPLNNAPSSWTSRPAPPSRRKSDAGNRSDSESGAFGRSLSRTRSRNPSNPTSPTTGSMSPDLHTSLASPPFRHSSRPASRASRRQSTPKRSSPYDDHDYSSPDDSHDSTASYDYRGERDDQEFIKSVSTLAMPRSSDSDSDDDDALGLVMDRSVASSTVSMEQSERLEALQKVNQELSQRAAESDRLLRRRIEEHENEVENYQIKLDELSSELSASKRDEKDLRNKERANTALISSLEAEIVKITKSLENARINYAGLQKLYQEQCTNSESYRADLRNRDEQIRALKDSQSNQDAESEKYKLQSEEYEARIAHLEAELELAQQVQAQLDEQKQENLLLKETIDRMRFDMDELRNNLTVAQGGSSSGTSSRANTMSKSLGAELANRMKDGWGGDDEEEDTPVAEEEEETTVEDGSDGESIVQTIITRKRKVASRANRVETITRHEEIKEYSDSSVQYEPALFLKSSAAQTMPPPPPPKVSSFSIQTEPEPPAEPVYITLPPPQRETAEMAIQTDPVEVVEVKEEEEETEMVASSSKQTIEDQPPAYTQITEEHDWQVAADTIKKWHAGVKLPLDAVRGGISPETLADWKAIKEELGVDCGVIDKIIAKSGERLPPKDDKGKRRRGRFYNIYNTYVYGAGGEGGIPASGIVAHTAIVVGASALVFLALGPYLGGHPAAPGSATYYDRAAWSSFNTIQAAGEGFMPPDGTATVWNFLGRVGGGAARAARGWPT